MGSEWARCRLGDLVEVKHGWAFKGAHMTEETSSGPIVVAIGNFEYTGGFRFESTRVKRYIDVFPEEYILRPGDVLLAMTCQTSGGEILGIPGVIPNDENIYLHNQRLGKVKVKEKAEIELEFLYWVFISPGFNRHLYLTSTGTKILHTSPGKIESYEFYLPPKAVRQRISDTLWSLNKKIEINRQINTTMESMAQALFKSWFVDFDPIIDNALVAGNSIPDALQARARARQEMRTAEDTSTLSLPAEIQQLFPSSFVFSEEMGWIPEGWGIKPLDEIAHYQNGLALQKFRPENEEDYLPVVKIAQLKKGYADGEEKASPSIKPECIIDNGDVVFSWSGSLMVDIWCGGKAALNQHLFKVTSLEFPRWFYLHFTLHHLAEFQRIAADKAVTMGHIKREHLSQAKCVVASEDLLEELSRIMGPMVERAILCRLQSRELAQTRDSILPKLLSGRLQIPEAEQQLAEVI